MTFRELYNRRLRIGGMATLLLPVVLLLCLICAVGVASVLGPEVGLAAAFGILGTYLWVALKISHWPFNNVECPYCGRRTCLPVRIHLRACLRDSLRIADNVTEFPCCGGSLDSEILEG